MYQIKEYGICTQCRGNLHHTGLCKFNIAAERAVVVEPHQRTESTILVTVSGKEDANSRLRAYRLSGRQVYISHE